MSVDRPAGSASVFHDALCRPDASRLMARRICLGLDTGAPRGAGSRPSRPAITYYTNWDNRVSRLAQVGLLPQAALPSPRSHACVQAEDLDFSERKVVTSAASRLRRSRRWRPG